MTQTKFNFDLPVERRGTRSVKWDEAPDTETLPLWVADMDFRTAPAITEALTRRAEHGVFGYSFPDKEYYDAIVDWFNTRHGWTIDPAHIIYTTGVVPAISAVIKALTQPGDKVLVQTPVYNCFFSSIRNNGCEVAESPLKRTEDSYEMDFEDLERQCADAQVKVLLLCNPHNPAGRVWTHDELRRVDEIASRHNVVVVSDEIHCEIVFRPHVFTPYATVARGEHVVCCSPSKAFNTAGLQTANIVAADDSMRRRIDKAININEVCDIGPFGIAGLIAAYTQGGEWLDACVEYIRGNYEYARERVNAIPGMKMLELQGTYLAWVDVTALDIPVAWLTDALTHEAKVWLQPGTAYGMAGEGYVRINLATQRSTLAEALDRIETWVKNR